MSTVGTSPWLLHVIASCWPVRQTGCATATVEIAGNAPVGATVNSLLSASTAPFTEDSMRTMYWPGVRPSGTSTSCMASRLVPCTDTIVASSSLTP
eukprot:scaffold80681_cov66-Phaeocystis_antarctica.AAC.3